MDILNEIMNFKHILHSQFFLQTALIWNVWYVLRSAKFYILPELHFYDTDNSNTVFSNPLS